MNIWINFVLNNEISLKSLRVINIQFLQTVSLLNEAQTSWESRKWSQTSKARDFKQSGARIFFPHVSRAERLAPARTRTRVVQLESQRIDPWTTEQSRGVGVPAVQLTTRVKSSTLYGRTIVRSYGRTSKFFPRDGLLRYCIIMGYALRAPLLIQYQPDEWWE